MSNTGVCPFSMSTEESMKNCHPLCVLRHNNECLIKSFLMANLKEKKATNS